MVLMLYDLYQESCIQLNNPTKDNRNHYVMAFLSMLIAQKVFQNL